ncbi:hypothetical protein GCM10023116_38440 [Kistimonas scapharcae]|uniref:AAA+ ATPase domain-containing protein n=1 Tax=Kistimonas scapharcae TaxID=1036133 RepID=A0ABP8V973_9GAMM
MHNMAFRHDSITEEQQAKIRQVRECYISSPNLDRILADIHRCRVISQCGGKPECMLVLGEPGAGKTTLREQYLRLNPRQEQAERTLISVFSTEFPDKTVPRQAAICFLEDLGHDLSPKGISAPQLTKMLARLMQECGVEISLLDEFQHLIETKSYEVLEDAAKWLKVVINTAGIPVVLFGMPYSRIILEHDDQLAGRFMIQRTIEPFRIISKEDRQNFRTFLKVFDESLPFTKTPELHGLEMYPRLFAFSKGNMRRLRNLINFSAEEAILNQDGELTVEHFSAGYRFYMQNIGKKDQIDSNEKLQDQPNPFDVPINELEFRQMELASCWNMTAEKGKSRITPAKYTRLIPLRQILKRR